MAKVKSMLKKCEVQTAERKRTCGHTKRDICKGEPCLVLFDCEHDRHNYSSEVALKMIEETRKRLVELEAELSDTYIAEKTARKTPGEKRNS